MKRINRIRNVYYLINAFYSLGISIFGAVLYLYFQDIGYNFAQINTFLAIFWIVSFITEIPAGVIADSYGRKNAVIASCIIRASGLFILFIDWGNITFLIAGAALTALGESLKSGSLESWMIDEIKKIDDTYTFEKIFSTSGALLTSLGLIAGFVGAQFIGEFQLALPVLIGGILLILTVLLVLLFVKEDKAPSTIAIHDIKQQFRKFKENVNEGITYIKKDNLYFLICISFLPLAFLLAGPNNQWQLFFQPSSDSIISGYLWVLLGLSGVIGAIFSRKIVKKINNKVNILIGSIVINSITIIICVLIDNFLLSIIIFLFHVTITASDEVIRITFLHESIHSKNRSTLISFFYTLEAGVTVISLIMIGVIADFFGIGISWIMAAIFTLVIGIPTFLKVKQRLKSSENINSSFSA
ncbi:MFS transporter [Sutcliffiella cohnii]